MLKKIFFLFFVVLSWHPGQILGQSNVASEHSFITRIDYLVSKSRIVPAPQDFTAVAIKSSTFQGDFIAATLENDTVRIPLDPDAPAFTYFISLPPAKELNLLLENGSFQVYYINSLAPPKVRSDRRKAFNDDCSELFSSVPQSEWRTGLPEPSYSRSFTDVAHVVIHHSAGSNTNDEYTQVVRDIYLYHTEVNGWSDIGYNYLIAQDGTIYDGRDPADGEQDNVMGAHFCGANSTTMGVCLLGNYQTAEPTSSSLLSLQQVITYKLAKENIDPYDQHSHALGNFEAIIGHRDGCSTSCPGENVYTLMNQIKSETQIRLNNNCSNNITSLDFKVDNTIIKTGDMVTFSNLSSGYDQYRWHLPGANPDSADWDGIGQARYRIPGIFPVTLIGLKGDQKDTLTRQAFMEVQGDPLVYPNPISTASSINIRHHFEVTAVFLFGINGSQFSIEKNTDGDYVLPELRPGVYILNIFTRRENFSKKIIVE